jgi:hypothetical protein
MAKFTNCLTLPILLVIFSASVYANSTLSVQGQATGYEVTLHITSPTQNAIYRTNTIPLNFSLSTNIPDSDVFYLSVCANLDGQPGYHGGTGIRLGQYPKPSPNYYYTINVTDGNHLLWVQADIRFYSKDGMVENLSQIVNFTVESGMATVTPTNQSTIYPTQQPTNVLTPTPLASPSPTVPEFQLAAAVTLLAVASIPLIYYKKLKKTIQNE